MCGIAGTLEFAGSRKPVEERIAELERMASLLGHRGPDEYGYFIDERAALGAVRLSIIDLEHGQQPMADPSQRYWIVCNGEIYNHIELRNELEHLGHQFGTRCDTEVALRAWMEWGERAAERFDGGFAFVLYDRQERVAFLVRDRFGKRPLFYHRQAGALVFGSEIKALLARSESSLSWDTGGLASIFAKWTPFGEETPFAGVRQVPAGTILRVSETGAAGHRFAGFPPATDSNLMAFDDAAEQTAAILRDSVRMRLRSDVEVGVLLSGGLDSTVITRLIHSEQPARLRSFSIAFSDAQFDESADQDRVVQAFDLNHASLRISAGDIADSFRQALWHAEVPQFRTAFVPMFLLSRFVRAEGIKVVLSGEGADEVFLGYDIFKETRLRESWPTLEPAERRARIRLLYPYLSHFSAANVRALEAMFARSYAAYEGPLFSHALRLENARLALRLLRTEADGLEGLLGAIAGVPGFDSLSALRKAQWIEFHTLLQGYLLSSQGDRMMFAHGVEPRCPFLSPPVVAFAADLPEGYLLSVAGNEKHVLKRAFHKSLPQEILARPKQPYRAPDASSFLVAHEGGRFVDWVEEVLDEKELRQIEPIDTEAAVRLLDKLRQTPQDKISPREDQAFMLLLSTCVLNRQFIRREGIAFQGKRPPLSRTVNLIGVPGSG